MSTQLRWPIPIVCLAVILGTAEEARAQADPQNYLFNTGQTIQPIFDGWVHNPDGSYEMHFGYLNRNYVEELAVPIGADNRMSPDGPDRGQPTFFYPRVNRRVFSVPVRPSGATRSWSGRSRFATRPIERSGGSSPSGRSRRTPPPVTSPRPRDKP